MRGVNVHTAAVHQPLDVRAGGLAEAVMMSYFKAVNNQPNKLLLNNVRLPITTISGVRIERQEENKNFAKMAMPSGFMGTFGLVKAAAIIPIVCGEPLQFRIGISTESSVRANLTNIRLCNVIEEEFVSEATADSSAILSRRIHDFRS
jgi:hypothetical protein